MTTLSSRTRSCTLVLLPLALGCGKDETPPPCEDGAAAVVGDQGADTVQEAIDSASAGGTVTVCAGTWTGNLTVEKDLVLESAEGIEDTLLDGGGTGSVIAVSSGASLTLRGLTVSGGAGTMVIGRLEMDGLAGGGLLAMDAGDIVVEDSVLTGNTADWGAGILVLDSASVTLDGAEIVKNAAALAGGGGYLSGVADVAVTGAAIEDNTALSAPGVAVAGSTSCAVDGTTNPAQRHHREPRRVRGGAHLSDDCTLTGTVIQDNTADELIGGGIVLKGATVTLVGTEIRDNVAAYGAGVAIDARGETDASLTGDEASVIEHNTAASLTYSAGGGVAAFASGGHTLRLTGLAISRNASAMGSGGGVYGEGTEGAVFVLDGLTLSQNTAGGDGGGAPSCGRWWARA